MNALLRVIVVALIWGMSGISTDAEYVSNLPTEDFSDTSVVRDFTKENLTSRLKLVEGVVDLNYCEDSRKLAMRYMLGGRHETKKLIERSFYYFPLFDHYLEKYNVPKELKYITLLESGLQTKRSSVAGARGLWQLMPATARWMGLKVNNQADDRTNPHISTEAAVQYLAMLYDQFEDWNLVLLAYNAGPGSVKKAIRMAQSREVSDLIHFLPKQTRKYLPFYTATVYALNYYPLYRIVPESNEKSYIIKDKVLEKNV